MEALLNLYIKSVEEMKEFEKEKDKENLKDL
jgi:hypothetical protein